MAALLKRQELLLELAAIKAQEDQLAERKSQVSSTLIDLMRATGQKTVVTPLESGESVKGTLVTPQGVTYDADRLKHALSAGQWKKVTVEVLDKQRLEAAVTNGAIDAQIVASCATITDIKPHIRLSGKYTHTLMSAYKTWQRSKRVRKPKKKVTTVHAVGGHL